jgi:PPK2 family polyphosphate:nucleotide phosphotransferase
MSKFDLNKISTGPPNDFDKKEVKKKLKKLKKKLEALQGLLYAQSEHALLIVLQGMDGSGKDGAIKNVFEAANPSGCRVFSFKKPSEQELKYDFLWRIHCAVPPKGMIHIFNRSHYEDVVIQKVHKWVDKKTIKKRYDEINEFENMLSDTGTTILKFYLHISKDEQIKRLAERMEDHTKMWKYNEADIKERQFWKEYRHAYQDAFENCSVAADWTIIPADDNRYKEYLIAEKVVDTLEGLNMKFPGLKSE